MGVVVKGNELLILTEAKLFISVFLKMLTMISRMKLILL